MSSATITSKGQLTLPKTVREGLGVGPGDRVEFVPQDGGAYLVMPVSSSVMALKGVIAPPKNPVSLDDMDRAIREGADDA